LAEALAVASGWSPARCDGLLARDGRDGYILIYEYGVDFVEPGTLARTPLLAFPSFDSGVVWAKFAEAGLIPGAQAQRRGRAFACASCDGSGIVRDEDPATGAYIWPMCPTCQGRLVRHDAPPLVTVALALAGDWDRVTAFEKRARVRVDQGEDFEVAWRIERGESRVRTNEAAAGPRYKVGTVEGPRVWLLMPGL
jgi:hypothetical protein